MIKFCEQAVFTLVLLVFVGFIFLLALDLGRLARLAPLVIVIPTLVLLVYQFGLDLVSWLALSKGRSRTMDLPGVDRLGEAQAQLEQRTEAMRRGRRELNMFFWVLLMFAFIFLFGFSFGVPLHTLLYLKVRSGEGWLLSTAMASGMWALLYGVFGLLLPVRLYEGQLWGWLGL
jgi:hypothetical protein